MHWLQLKDGRLSPLQIAVLKIDSFVWKFKSIFSFLFFMNVVVEADVVRAKLSLWLNSLKVP